MADIRMKVDLRPAKATRKTMAELRSSRRIPGVVYGGNGENRLVVIEERALADALKTGGANAIIRLQHEKGEDTVILKEIQRHAVTSVPLHVDFQRIDLKKAISVKVPTHPVGEAPGVKLQAGILDQTMRELLIEALPGDIPQRIDVDISALEIGKAIHVKDIAVPKGVKLLDDPERIVVHVMVPAAEEAPAPAEGAAAGAEPEVIAKGKKEEEGEAAAGAEAKKEPAGKKEAAPKKEEKK